MARTDWSDFEIYGGSDINKGLNEPKQTIPLFVNPTDNDFGWFFSQKQSFGYRTSFAESASGEQYYGGRFITSTGNFYLFSIPLGSTYANFTQFLDYQFYEVQDLFDDASVSGSWTTAGPGSVTETGGYINIKSDNNDANPSYAIWTGKNYYGGVNNILFDIKDSGDSSRHHRMYLQDENGSTVLINDVADLADVEAGWGHYQVMVDGLHNKALRWWYPVSVTRGFSFGSVDLSTLGGSVWNLKFEAEGTGATIANMQVRYYVDGPITSPQSTATPYGRTDLNASAAMTEGIESTLTAGSVFIGSITLTIASNEVGLFRGGVVTWREN